MNLVKLYDSKGNCLKRIKQEGKITDKQIVEAIWEIEDVLGIEKNEIKVEKYKT